VLPGLIVCSGTFLNVRFTRRIPLICGWVGGFVFQAWARSTFLGASFPAALMPMTGLAFVLFSFYMVTDPATTPSASRAQAVFGASVALAYGVLMSVHIVFGMFFALAFVCLLRGAILAFQSGRRLEIVEIIPAKSGAREDPTLLRQRRRHHASV
jgi:Na+-translocating ferredoxin:NAD+ oxidoreductase RnfD subunit